MIERITWYDHASFRLDGERTVYIDPWELPPGQPRADLILISHEHYDHLSLDDVARLSGPETVIVTSADVARKLTGRKVVTLAPGQTVQVREVPVEGVAAYNVAKKFHPRANGWLGFVVTLRGQRIYYTGDSDATPEMRRTRADILLCPVGGTYTMNAQEAAEVANELRPQFAVPYHWGKIVGEDKDARRFAELCQGEVRVLPKAAPRPKK